MLLATLWRGGALVLTGDPEKTIKSLAIYKVQNMVGSPRSLLNLVEAMKSTRNIYLDWKPFSLQEALCRTTCPNGSGFAYAKSD